MIFHYLKNLAASHYDMRSSFLCELTGTRFLYKFLVRLWFCDRPKVTSCVSSGMLNSTRSADETELTAIVVAPQYLSDQLHRVADVPSWSRLRSAFSNWLDIRPSWLVTVGDRSFAPAGPSVWNSLPEDVTSALSLPVFDVNWRLTCFGTRTQTSLLCLKFFYYRPLQKTAV